MNRVLTTLIALLSLLSSPSRAESPTPVSIPLCGATVGALFVHEVKVPGKPDKYMHCSISCVMALYCGPLESFEVGVLKEVYDAMGFGDPDLNDIRADERGIRIAFSSGFLRTRKACYDECSKVFP